MKNNLRVLATLIALIGSTAIVADESTGPYITAGYNWFNFDGDRTIEDEDNGYLSLGYQTSSNIGFELKYTDVEMEYFNLSGIYRYQPKSESSFFWKGGIGKYDTRNGIASENRNNFNLGAGYEAFFSKSTSVIAGIDAIYQKDGGYKDWVPYIGLSYYFGGNSSKPTKIVRPIAPTNKDSDNDGVFDRNDSCNDSSAGVVVDAKGCEVDSDSDGVVDSKDSCLQTPAGAKVKADGCREMLTKDVSIELHVQFANNSNVVSDQYRAEFEKVANFMKQYPDTSVVIEGHTDSRGAASYNKNLSQKRADAVVAYLVSQFGIELNRVSAEGKGEVSPITTNDTKEGRAKNRRVQAEIKTSVTAAQ